ncbi:hypothetical protein BUALT_Bualt14G0047500 [Buddleja alternifolia]|uniref:Inhibitor I9 domain-containing protein n=1 Tax=Buddleja alternifolia TaxID=168488 RepID=A0AAV6WGN3_9LAMI|nr:hypothetical protein BUALT_Bualt14G0047500 [Buddleja alternifolia]
MDDLQGWSQTFLPSTLSITNEPRIIYSYRNVFKGFAARLSPEEAKAMEIKPGVVSVRPQKTLPLHTTHSTHFFGLDEDVGFCGDSDYGRGEIIGVLDNDINLDHSSFDEEGHDKLIRARYFRIGNETPLDEDGHGTQTTAHESDILAAIDDDGVDVLSISLDGSATTSYNEIAIGAFSAIESGIRKPDIIGPRRKLLEASYVSVEKKAHTNSKFNIISRISMSCTLQFSALDQTLTYQVTFGRLSNTMGNIVVEGFLTWNSANFSVRGYVVCRL